MFHTPNERAGIGRRAFAHETAKEEAAREYSVSIRSIVNYVKEYMKSAGIEAIPEALNIVRKISSAARFSATGRA